MSNILTLYNMEFKRIYKLYFSLIATLFAGNLISLLLAINDTIRFIKRSEMIQINFNMLKNYINEEHIKTHLIDQIQFFSSFVLAIGVLACLVYGLIIWYRDYYSRSKTICTLLILPQNRFNIYLSKLITILVMIYGVIVSQVLFWYIDYIILNSLLNSNIDGFINIMNGSLDLSLISANIIDFFMIDIFGVLLAVVVIFAGVLIERSYKKKGIVFGIVYILSSLVIYYCLIIKYSNYTDEFLQISLIYFVVSLVLSIGISYKLIKSKITL